MVWLLLVLVFDVNGTEVRPREILHKPYGTHAACDAAGENFRSIVAVPEEAKSVSMCVPKDWYDASGWKREEIG